MGLITRLIALFVVFPATFYFVSWLLCSLLQLGGIPLIADVVSLASAVAAAWYVWRKTASIDEGALSAIFSSAAVVGTIGFIGGFFGPMIFTPEANQGPMLGIFITGPAGFVLGGLGGFIHWAVKGRTGAHRKP